jgi:hypothetical protein
MGRVVPMREEGERTQGNKMISGFVAFMTHIKVSHGSYSLSVSLLSLRQWIPKLKSSLTMGIDCNGRGDMIGSMLGLLIL